MQSHGRKTTVYVGKAIDKNKFTEKVDMVSYFQSYVKYS